MRLKTAWPVIAALVFWQPARVSAAPPGQFAPTAEGPLPEAEPSHVDVLYAYANWPG